MDPTRLGWTVLLLGGNSGTGKSTLAMDLAAQRRAGLTQADDVRLALQKTVRPVDEQALHFFSAQREVWAMPPETLRDALIAIATRLEPALQAIIEHHVATQVPLILEGDGISPALAGRAVASGNGRVDALFVIETDPDVLLARMQRRGRGFDALMDETQRRQVQMNVLYGIWLRDEAVRLGLRATSAVHGSST